MVEVMRKLFYQAGERLGRGEKQKEPDHRYDITIGPELIDSYGHVENGLYLRLGDLGAQAFVASKGMPIDRIEEEYDLVPRKRATTKMEWIGDAVQGDTVTVCTGLIGIGNSSIRFRQHIEKGDQRITDLGVVTYVMIDKVSGRPTRIPDAIRSRLQPSRRRQ